MTPAKPFPITKRQVWEAYKRVRANQGGLGVDAQSLAEFAADLENNLHKLWNRLASGSYMPTPVKRVEIPKSGGGVRPSGDPDGRGSDRPDGRQASPGAGTGGSFPSRLLRLSARRFAD
jgi:hypothetical protein